MNKFILVEQLNILIEAAVKNGADCGGSYNQNMEELYKSIKNLMNLFTLNDEYDIIETGNRGYYSPYLIKRREN